MDARVISAFTRVFAALLPAHDESLCGTMFRPFPILAAAPYLDDGKSSRPAGGAEAKARSGQAFEEGPGEAHARQGGAAGAAADGARARRPDSGRRRTIRSIGAPISPPLTARASRRRRAWARRRRRPTGALRRWA